MSSPLDEMSLTPDDLTVGMLVSIYEYADGGSEPINLDWISMSSYEVTERTEASFVGKLITGSTSNTFPFKDFGLEPITANTWSTKHCVVPYEYARSESHSWWSKHRPETGTPSVFQVAGNRLPAADVRHPKAHA